MSALGLVYDQNALVMQWEAAEAITSGLAVTPSSNNKIGICHYSGYVLGVSTIPASRGEQCSVAVQGVVEMYTTGVGNTTFGQFLAASAGKAARVIGSGTEQLTYGGERGQVIGMAAEDITRNTSGKIILTL